jgi:hypothetical protein
MTEVIDTFSLQQVIKKAEANGMNVDVVEQLVEAKTIK